MTCDPTSWGVFSDCKSQTPQYPKKKWMPCSSQLILSWIGLRMLLLLSWLLRTIFFPAANHSNGKLPFKFGPDQNIVQYNIYSIMFLLTVMLGYWRASRICSESCCRPSVLTLKEERSEPQIQHNDTLSVCWSSQKKSGTSMHIVHSYPHSYGKQCTLLAFHGLVKSQRTDYTKPVFWRQVKTDHQTNHILIYRMSRQHLEPLQDSCLQRHWDPDATQLDPNWPDRDNCDQHEAVDGWFFYLNFRCRIYPLVNKHSYWTWPFVVFFSIKNGDFP